MVTRISVEYKICSIDTPLRSDQRSLASSFLKLIGPVSHVTTVERADWSRRKNMCGPRISFEGSGRREDGTRILLLTVLLLLYSLRNKKGEGSFICSFIILVSPIVM